MTQWRGNMMEQTATSIRAVLSSVVLTLLMLFDTTPLYAQSNLHTDTSGYTTGTIGSNSVSIYRDRYGNTTGSIGSKRITTYSDGYSGTTGTIGNNRVNTYSDGFGS